MLKIKLTRLGKKNQPHYRIVINEARDKRDGSYVEMIGYYAPMQTPKVLELDIKKYDAWIAKGAQPTETVAYLYTVVKAGKGFPEKKAKPSKKQLAKKEEAKQAKEEVKVEKEEKVEEVKQETPAVEKESSAPVKEVEAKEAKTEEKKE